MQPHRLSLEFLLPLIAMFFYTSFQSFKNPSEKVKQIKAIILLSGGWERKNFVIPLSFSRMSYELQKQSSNFS